MGNMAKIVKMSLGIFFIVEAINCNFLANDSHGNEVILRGNFDAMRNEVTEKTLKNLNMKIADESEYGVDSGRPENDSSRKFSQQGSENNNSDKLSLNPQKMGPTQVTASNFSISKMPRLLENLYLKIKQIFNEEESKSERENFRTKRGVPEGNDTIAYSKMSNEPSHGEKVRVTRSFPMIAPYHGKKNAFPMLRTGLQKTKADDFPSTRSFILAQERDKFQPITYYEFPATRRLKKFKIKNNLLNIYKVRPPLLTNSNSSSSIKTFKWMNAKKINGKKKNLGKEAEPSYPHLSDVMHVRTPGHPVRVSRSRYRCQTGTSGTLSIRDGRTVSSRGLSYSENDGADLKSLLCKSETSEITRPNEDIFLKNSVNSLNVITTDYDPFKFLERGEDINHNILEIGSKASSGLNVNSTRNQTTSSVETQDKGTNSMSRTNAKFIYDGGLRTAVETSADVEGSSTFNMPENQNPLILTSKQEESSSIIQNPSRHTEVNRQEENGDVATFLKYKKKTDFDIAFRNLFDR